MIVNKIASRISLGSRAFAKNNRFIRFNSSNTKDIVIQRYQDKLKERANALGLKDVDELKDKLKDDIEKKKKEFSAVDPLKELEEYERRQALEIQKNNDKTIKVRSPIDKNTPQAPYKVLNSYVDVEKVKDLPLKELEFIWRARFQNTERSMVALLNNLQFASMYANAFKNPSFILPLPKDEDGYEMHFVQWSFVGPKTTHCMLTTVAEYKLHKEYAKPHTTLMFHQDLSETKDVVLMNGQVEKESSLTMDEAQLLVLNVQRFYGGITSAKGNDKKLALLRDFTSGNADFNMDELIAEAASID
ncbi:uncharacterized protein AC631_00922 [Debaryomyces fabryi]|uniref:Protein ATP11, mitochondrial n=1 Tax=Debaryomyces fabryi TaxID=58627 RepID=A0A0V1Q440_9ASCO|nr:uncharacterized protein AC631_00922 [Debaryomyces fabryi]KSA03284.1 hypothetical protein AC631_00922 [Debaryomyces fabryi]CUM45108.1 unnamed protein product [Debaryomyces fabryi]